MTKFDLWLKREAACNPARKWAAGKTFEEFYTTCHRGDWLCWLFALTNPDDKRLLTLVKGLQVNEIRHLLADQRSVKAVDTAIAYGNGQATDDELSDASFAAFAAADAAADAAVASSFAASSSFAAFAAAFAAAAAAADAAVAAVAAARDKSFARFADIFRENIPIEMINRPWDEAE